MRCGQVRGRVQLGTRYIRLARICGCHEHFTVGEFFSLKFSFKWETRKRAGTPTAAYCFPLLERPIPHSLSLCLCVRVCLSLSLSFFYLRSVLFFFSQGFANSSDPLQVRFFTCFFPRPNSSFCLLYAASTADFSVVLLNLRRILS